MADVPARFKVDLSQVRGAFGEIRRLSGSIGAGQFAGVTKGVQATNRELAASPGFAARFTSAMARTARVAAGIAAVTTALVILNRRFPVIGEVATKAFQAITKGGNLAISTASKLSGTLSMLRVAAGAAVGIYSLAKAFQALRGATTNLPQPKIPGVGGSGGGGSAFKGGLAGGLIGSLTGSLLRKAAAPVMAGLMGAADFEQIEISFEVMAGGLAPAEKLLGDIRTMAAKTPFTLPGLADAGKTLLAFGLEADTIPKRLRMIGDIAGGNQQKLDSAALVFGQIASAGRLMGQDLLQLVNLGFNPLQIISERTGESMVSLKKRMEDGAVSFAEVEGAFISATSAGGRFYQMTERQSGTFLGLMSTMKDAVDAARRAFATPIMGALKPAIAAVTEFFEAGEGRAAAMGERVARVIDFVRAAFGTMSGGEMWQAVKLGLEIAFKSGLNVLFRGIEALGDAMKDADFMSQVKSTLEIAALRFREIMLGASTEVMAALSHGAEALPGGKKSRLAVAFGNAAHLAAGSQELATAQREALEASKDPGQVGLLSRLKEFYDGTKNTFDLEGLKKELGDVIGAAMVKADEYTMARQKAKAGGTPTAPPTREGLIPQGGAGGTVSGAFQRAINLIQGRTVNELVAAEAQKTNQLLQGMARTAAETRTAAQETARKVGKPQKVAVTVLPVFGNAVA